MQPIRGSMTTAYAQALAAHELNGSASPVPATWYVGLATGGFSTAAAPAEVAGSGYARQPLARDGTAWSLSGVTGKYETAVAVTWNGGAALSAAWGGGEPTTLIVLYDALTGGNARWIFELAAPVTLSTGSAAPTIPAGQLSLL